jgi:hypothetical protein
MPSPCCAPLRICNPQAPKPKLETRLKIDMGESKHTIGKGLPLLLLLLHKATNQQQQWRNMEVISSLVYSVCLLLTPSTMCKILIQISSKKKKKKRTQSSTCFLSPSDLGAFLPMLQDPLREVKRKTREKTKTKDATKKNMGTRLR